MSQEHDPISAAATILEVTSGALMDMLNLELGDNLSDESKEHLATIWDNLEALPKDFKKLKCKLEDNGFKSTKKGKSKQSQDDLGSEDHANKLWENTTNESQDLADFIKTSFDPTKRDAITLLHLGFSSALMEMNVTTRDLSKHIEELVTCASSSAIAQTCANTRLTFSAISLRNTYDAISDSTGSLNIPGAPWWLQHICRSLHLLWFALQWNNLAGKDANKDKEKIVVAVFFKSVDRQMDKKTKKSNEWKTFKTQFNSTRTGANHLLEAYETVGTVIILDPIFEFHCFQDSHVGPKVPQLLEQLCLKLGKYNRIRQFEPHRLALLAVVIKKLCPNLDGIMVLLKNVKEKADLEFVDDAPELGEEE
ncbi:hypothetical protein FRC10_002707 [Ceratobasidium sp. 414]|nr:hypothetical protein FRC10_002707 [Ceratobasidium sp. 414]